ncbi:hypothetical protein HDE_04113 [Halotydeus destructor]|nr:hypothetical protein HDE_04113 [Halotydeus destructor]
MSNTVLSSVDVQEIGISQDDFSKIISTNVASDMQEAALKLAHIAADMFKKAEDIARYVRDEFDASYGKPWQCIIRKSYTSDIAIDIADHDYILFNFNIYEVFLFRSQRFADAKKIQNENHN